MPLIDLHCHYGITPETLALRAPEMSAAKTYADQFGVEVLCFSAQQAASDLVGGNAALHQQLGTDSRFQGWLTLSVHQPEVSADLAKSYLLKRNFCGSFLIQDSDADTVTNQGGREVLNALRRYSKPVLLSVTSPATLEAALTAASEFASLKFLLSPQTAYLTSVCIPAMKEVINTIFLPVAAFTERDSIAQAVGTLGDRRVAWASDWGRFHPAGALGMIRDSALSSSQRDRVGQRNARDLLV